MKEKSLIEMKNKVDSLIRVLQHVMTEQQHLTTLATGTLETIKLMPGYDDAIKTLTDKLKEKEESGKKLELDMDVEI